MNKNYVFIPYLNLLRKKVTGFFLRPTQIFSLKLQIYAFFSIMSIMGLTFWVKRTSKRFNEFLTVGNKLKKKSDFVIILVFGGTSRVMIFLNYNFYNAFLANCEPLWPVFGQKLIIEDKFSEGVWKFGFLMFKTFKNLETVSNFVYNFKKPVRF